jgi:Tfp pilus assembly protein PilF
VALDRYPELARLVSGRERLINGDAAGAESALREAVRLDPRSLDALVSLGEVLTQQKKHRQAEDVLRRAVKVEPSNGDAHLRLGRCLMEQDNYNAALVPLRSAVQYMPTSAEAHTALADALAKTGATNEADEHRQIAERLGKASAAGR